MRLTISGEATEVQPMTHLVELLAHLGIDRTKHGVAIARNGQIVPKPRWEAEPLDDGDAIEIVRASQGG